MSNHFKPIPQDAVQTSTIQYFRETGEKFASTIPGAAPFDLSKVRVFNRSTSDGKYQLLYQDNKANLTIAGEVNLKNHEMEIVACNPNTGKCKNIGQKTLNDGCSSSKLLIGDEEVGAKECHDKEVSPKLISSESISPSVRQFQAYCEQKLGKINTSSPTTFPFSLARTFVENPGDTLPHYFLQYKSHNPNFFCEAKVNPDVHKMLLRHGSLDQFETAPFDAVVEMTDACSLTTHLLGAQKLLGDCENKTSTERAWEDILTKVFYGVMSGIALYASYKIAKWFSVGVWRAAAPRLLPLAQGAISRGLPYITAFGSRSIGALGALRGIPIGNVGWAARGGAVGLAFGGGVLVGMGIDRIPKLFGGKQISDYAADGLYAVAGPPPGWMVDAYDWVGSWF